MATRKKTKKVKTKKAASSGMSLDYKPIEMFTAVVGSVILAIMVISYVGWKIKKNSNREISARGYSKVTKFYRDYYSMRRDIRDALKDDKITYKELKELKAKYREAAKKKMK